MAKRWKANQIDYAALLEFDTEEDIRVCLTQRQVSVLKAMLVPAYWATRWLNLSVDDDTLQLQIAEIDSRLDGNDCECPMLDFRDNPDDLCEVQYSKNEGETWLTMFRKDTCAPRGKATTVDIDNTYTNIEETTTNNTNYAGDILNVAPQWEYTDPFSDRALCLTIEKYVQFISELSIQEIETGNVERRADNDLLEDAADFISTIVISVIAAVVGTVTMPAIVAGAVTWSVMVIAESVWDYLVTKSSADFEDQDARDAVSCWMFNKLRGSTPIYDKWSVSLDDFEGETDEEITIAEVVDIFNKNIDVFINWMILFQDINSVAASLPECDCPQPLIINQLAGQFYLDFFGTEFTEPSSVPLGNPPGATTVAPGVWFPSNEYYYDIASPIGGVACNIEVVLPNDVLVTRIRVGMGSNRVAGFTQGDRLYSGWLGDPATDGVKIIEGGWGAGEYEEQTIITDNEDVEGLTDTPRTHFYLHNSADRDEGSCWVFWIYIECIPYEP